MMKKKLIIYLTLISAVLCSCNNPEKSYQRALDSRKLDDFENIVVKYPESKFSDSAQKKISDIIFWLKIDLNFQKNEYKNYLDSFPIGLYRREAKLRLNEVNSLLAARDLDIIRAYATFQDSFPNSLFYDSISNRIKYLKPAFKEYQVVKDNDNIVKLFLFVLHFNETGYSKIVQSRLDSIVTIQSEKTILSDKRYDALPKSMDLLQDYIKVQEDSNLVLLAKQAVEEIIIENITNSGNGHRFVMLDIDIKQNSRNFYLDNRLYYRFLIEEVDSQDNSKPIWIRYDVKSKHGSDQANFKLRRSSSRDEKLVRITLQYPYDAFLVEGDIYGYYTEAVITKQKLPSTLHPGLNKRKHYYDRNVWRFSGEIKAIDGYTIIGEKNDPLSFCLFKDVGAVYLYGKGQIIHDGIITKLGYD